MEMGSSGCIKQPLKGWFWLNRRMFGYSTLRALQKYQNRIFALKYFLVLPTRDGRSWQGGISTFSLSKQGSGHEINGTVFMKSMKSNPDLGTCLKKDKTEMIKSDLSTPKTFYSHYKSHSSCHKLQVWTSLQVEAGERATRSLEHPRESLRVKLQRIAAMYDPDGFIRKTNITFWLSETRRILIFSRTNLVSN